jgi:DNA-binding NtrC family response regulator
MALKQTRNRGIAENPESRSGTTVTTRTQIGLSSASVLVLRGSRRCYRGEEALMAKILIVEDDDATRTGYREFLKLAGHDVIATSTYQEGRDAAAAESPDLVIADLRLGGFNGLQLLLLSPQPIPTIIVTGFHDEVLEAEARRAGADYVVKPISPASLVTLVKERLERSSSPQ